MTFSTICFHCCRIAVCKKEGTLLRINVQTKPEYSKPLNRSSIQNPLIWYHIHFKLKLCYAPFLCNFLFNIKLSINVSREKWKNYLIFIYRHYSVAGKLCLEIRKGWKIPENSMDAALPYL